MQVVDRHGWVEGMTIRAFGREVGFRADAPGIMERLSEVMPPGWARSDRVEVRRLYSLRLGGMPGHRPGTIRRHVLFMNARSIYRSHDFRSVLDHLESDLQLYLAERASRRIFVHAGVVGYAGKAIVLPGRTLTGKTTLVEELLRLGATYYSDEYAVFSEAGRVYPFAKPLSVREKRGHGRPIRRDPSQYHAEVGSKPLPVGLVVLTRYRPGVTFRPRRMTNGKAILALLENTVPARRRPKKSFRTLERVVSNAPVLRGSRGDAHQAAEAILRRLE